MFAKIREKFAGFMDNHPKAAPAIAGTMAIAGVAGAVLGNASAEEITTATTSFYGLTIVDWFLEVVGAIALLGGGLFLRDFRALAIGAALMILGGVAFYLGV